MPEATFTSGQAQLSEIMLFAARADMRRFRFRR